MAPDMPADIQFDGQLLHFESQLMQNASHAAEGTKIRPGVMVFKCSLSPGHQAVVAKVPALEALARQEVSIGMSESRLLCGCYLLRRTHTQVNVNVAQHCSQERKLQIVSGIPGVAEHCVRLLRSCGVTLRGSERTLLVLTPLAELIPFTISTEALLAYVRELVGIIGSLEEAGYLHGDLSYYNLLIKQDGKPLLVDLQTLMTVEEVISL